MPYSTPDKRRANDALPDVRTRQRERARARGWKRSPHGKERRAARSRERYATDSAFRQRERERMTDAAIVAAMSANKQARRLGIEGLLSADHIRALWTRQPSCISCGDGRGVDHVIPMSRGGTNTPANVQTLCPSCNSIKRHRLMTPTEIAARKAILRAGLA